MWICKMCEISNEDQLDYCKACGAAKNEYIPQLSEFELCEQIEQLLKERRFLEARIMASRLIRKKPKISKAYMLRLCADKMVSQEKELASLSESIAKEADYRSILKLADSEERCRYENYERQIQKRINKKTCNEDQQTCYSMNREEKTSLSAIHPTKKRSTLSDSLIYGLEMLRNLRDVF